MRCDDRFDLSSYEDRGTRQPEAEALLVVRAGSAEPRHAVDDVAIVLQLLPDVRHTARSWGRASHGLRIAWPRLERPSVADVSQNGTTGSGSQTVDYAANR